MTTEEKLRLVGAQSTIYSGEIPELGIPAMCLADGATGITLGQVLINAAGKLGDGEGAAVASLFGRLEKTRQLLAESPAVSAWARCWMQR